jgi:hypothetical protein
MARVRFSPLAIVRERRDLTEWGFEPTLLKLVEGPNLGRARRLSLSGAGNEKFESTIDT